MPCFCDCSGALNAIIKDWSVNGIFAAFSGTPFTVDTSSSSCNCPGNPQGADQVECSVDDKPWVQQPFPYQAKCLQWLREQRAALSADDRATVDGWLDGTGCEALFAGV